MLPDVILKQGGCQKARDGVKPHLKQTSVAFFGREIAWSVSPFPFSVGAFFTQRATGFAFDGEVDCQVPDYGRVSVSSPVGKQDDYYRKYSSKCFNKNSNNEWWLKIGLPSKSLMIYLNSHLNLA